MLIGPCAKYTASSVGRQSETLRIDIRVFFVWYLIFGDFMKSENLPGRYIQLFTKTSDSMASSNAHSKPNKRHHKQKSNFHSLGCLN